MKRVAIIAALLWVVLCSGCQTSEVRRAQIAAADSLAVIMPDSALSLIRSVDRRRVYGDADRAAYGLAYSHAADFCDLSIDLDTLIAPAVEYYIGHDMPVEAGRACYYQALTHEYGHRDSIALRCLIEGEKFASAGGDLHTCGLIWSGMGRLYDNQQFNAEAIEAFGRAAEVFEAAGERRNSMYVYINRSYNHMLSLDYDNAMRDDSLALAIAYELCDTTWIKATLSMLAKAMWHKTDDPRPALELLQYNYRTYYGGEVPAGDYSTLYQLYETMGRPDEAMYYLNLDYENRDLCPLTSQPGMYLLMSDAARRRGQYDKAFEYYDMVLEVDDSIHRQIQQTALLEVEHRYRFELLESENARAMAQKRAQLTTIIAVAILVAAIALYFVLMFVRERRNKRHDIDELMAAFDSERNNTENTFVAQLDEHVEHERRLKELLELRFSELRSIASNYFKFGSNKEKLRDEMAKVVSLKAFDNAMFATIEEVVNATKSDVIVCLRNLNSISEDDLHLLILVYAGFTNEEISVILGLSVTNTAVRKTRLRSRLAKFVSQSPDFIF